MSEKTTAAPGHGAAVVAIVVEHMAMRCHAPQIAREARTAFYLY